MHPVTPTHTLLARIGTFYYFGFFLLMPFYSKMISTKPVPDRVTYEAH
jgi:ubiquinol-cytochrome c reductase cytochrome b subunit